MQRRSREKGLQAGSTAAEAVIGVKATPAKAAACFAAVIMTMGVKSLQSSGMMQVAETALPES